MMNNFKKEIEYINHRIDYINKYISMLERDGIVCDKNLQKDRIEIYETIKFALFILNLLIKWKEFINIKQNYEYLLNDEIRLFDSDIMLVNNYFKHFLHSYVPITYRHLKKESEKNE